MQGPLRLLTAVALSASLLTACGRKKQEQTESTPSSKQSPQAEQVARLAASDEKELRKIEAESPPKEHAPKAEIPVPADSPVAAAPESVSPEASESDVVYEAWFRKYQLNLNDPNMLDSDTDGDGVSNRDEFMADTNPRDPKSFPARVAAAKANAHSGLKLKEYTEVQVPVILESVDGSTARIKRLDQGEKIETIKAGQTVQGLGLKVEKVQSRRMTDKHGAGVDASQVILENPSTKEKMMLVKDMPARSSSSSAVLVSEDGKTSLTVHEGETFDWPKAGGSTYKVMDLRAEQVVLQDQSTGRMWTVAK